MGLIMAEKNDPMRFIKFLSKCGALIDITAIILLLFIFYKVTYAVELLKGLVRFITDQGLAL